MVKEIEINDVVEELREERRRKINQGNLELLPEIRILCTTLL
jgi:hypothetical protein